MASFQSWNPFGRRETHSQSSILVYRLLTLLSWLLALIVSVYYVVRAPSDGHKPHRRFWDQNNVYRTAFTLSPVLTDIYWIVLFILQIGYIAHLFSRNVQLVGWAASVGSHFILNNLFHFAFVMLFVRGHFAWAEVILIINLINLLSAYLRHSTYPPFIHAPAISGPLAWTFVAIFWNGALMVVHPHNLVARIFGNIFIWAILLFGLFFTVVYKDYSLGFALSVLTAALGVAQFERQVIALQWIFAFVIMAVLFLVTVFVAVPAWTGRDHLWRRSAVTADAERAPLLNE